MLEVRRTHMTALVKWIPFYPVLERGDDDGDDIIDLRLLHEMDDVIFGKYQEGITGSSLLWIYTIVPRSELRESVMISKTIF